MGSKPRLPASAAGLIVALLVAASCGDDDDDRAEPTTTTEPPRCSVVEPGAERVDLGDRWYRRAVPPEHDGSTDVPLVVDLHGFGEGAILHEGVTGFGDHGESNGFITLTPQAQGDVPGWDLRPDGVDVTFVGDMLDDAIDALCVDEDRVYLTGHSMGGFLISTLACTSADRFAAMAPVAGMRAVEPCDPAAVVPVLAVHSTGDHSVRYDGGLHPGAAELLGLPETGPSIPSLVSDWAARNGCAGDPTTDEGDGFAVLTYPCDPDATVQLHRIQGGRHEWPPNTTETVWSFFLRHAR